MRRVALVVASMALVSGVLLTYPVSASKASQDPKEWPARKVCITYLDSHVDALGRETFTTIRWYYVDSAADSGQFKIIRKWIGKARRVAFAHDTDGLVAEIDTKEKIKLGDCASAFQLESPNDVMQTDFSRRSHTAEYFLRSPTFTRTDAVAGFNVFVWRRYAAEGQWFETAYSPQVGAPALSTIHHLSDGSERRSVAIKVQLL